MSHIKKSFKLSYRMCISVTCFLLCDIILAWLLDKAHNGLLYEVGPCVFSRVEDQFVNVSRGNSTIPFIAGTIDRMLDVLSPT